MNLGFSGPIADREGVDENDRSGIKLDGHLRRLSERSEVWGNEGGIVV